MAWWRSVVLGSGIWRQQGVPKAMSKEGEDKDKGPSPEQFQRKSVKSIPSPPRISETVETTVMLLENRWNVKR